jgi:acetyl esterase
LGQTLAEKGAMLHPQTRELLDKIERSGAIPIFRLPPSEARQVYRDYRFATQPAPPAVESVEDLSAHQDGLTIPLRLYRPHGMPRTGALPALVFFHGGGFVIGDLDSHDVLCRQLSNASGCAIVAVDYRLAPESRFPAAFEDCKAATQWVHQNSASLGIDSARIAVGGDSAGANLAAVVSIAARDAGATQIRFQLLIYPQTEMRSAALSHQTNGQGYALTREAVEYFHDQYIDDPSHDKDWRASPLLCKTLGDLPPSLVLTAGYDPLRDEALAYAQQLSLAGNRVTHICFERQIHGFITMGKVIDEANAAVAICASELKRALSPAESD